MISFVHGTVAHKGVNFVVIDVGGIGLKLSVPMRNAELSKVGEDVFFNTYFSVKEDSMELYGFSSEKDLEMFNLLIGVNGVGPKAALSLLSSFTAEALSAAVIKSDSKTIASAQGIGAKTAQRIILELADKVAAYSTEEASVVQEASGSANEAVSALMALGYSAAEASEAVKKAGKCDSVENTVKAALISLMR